jgi:hypothetical protein
MATDNMTQSTRPSVILHFFGRTCEQLFTRTRFQKSLLQICTITVAPLIDAFVDTTAVALGPNDQRGAGVHDGLAAADAGDLLAVDGDAGGRGRRVRRQAAAQGPAGRRCYGLEGFSGTVPSGYEEVHLLWCLVL